MRIAYVLTTLGLGGAEKQVIALAERMAARGHTITLIVLKHDSGEEWPVELPVMRLNMVKTPRSLLHGLGFAQKFLDVFRPDLLHSHTFPANAFARLLCMRGTSTTLINTIHNVYEGGWHRMLFYRLTSRWAYHVTAVSAAVAERFMVLRAIDPKKISVITNGIDMREFTPDRKRRRATRRELAAHAFVWLAAGRLVSAKDYPTMLRAFAQVHQLHPTAELWIAGEGSASDSELGINSSTVGVHLLGLRRDIPALLDAADGFVLSSAWEGLPLALGEAMAMEKPVVATDVGGVRELVAEEGLLVAAKDSEQLATAMQMVMAMNDFQRTALGRAARARIQMHFSIEAKADTWEKLYHDLLGEQLG